MIQASGDLRCSSSCGEAVSPEAAASISLLSVFHDCFRGEGGPPVVLFVCARWPPAGGTRSRCRRLYERMRYPEIGGSVPGPRSGQERSTHSLPQPHSIVVLVYLERRLGLPVEKPTGSGS